MTRLNHSRPTLKLLDARKRGLAISSLVAKYFPSASVSAPLKKPQQQAGDRELMHDVAVAILDHIDRHGDYTDADKLIEFARNEPERDAIRQWFSRYSKLNVSPGSQKFSFIKTKLSDRASAIANPYWTLKQPSKRRDVSFADSLAALVAKARKQQEAGDSTDAARLKHRNAASPSRRAMSRYWRSPATTTTTLQAS